MHRQSAGRASISSSGNRRSSVGPLRVKHDNAAASTSRAAGNGFMRRSSGAGAAGPRKSTAPKSNFGFSNTRRPSSGYGRSNMSREVLRESRPISDKSYMQKEIRRIIDFLQEHGFSHPISVKQLMSPTTKDFVRVFQFLYNFLDEDYVVGPKIDEEIPAKFKELKYPFTISKSSMCTLGSSHAWPHVLAALHWLCDFIQYAMNTRVSEILFTDEDVPGCLDEQAYSEMHFDYLENTYAEYMNGQDQYDVHERKLREAIQMSKGGDINMDNLVAEEERLKAELQELEQQQSRIPNLQEQMKAKTIDCERFSNYLVSLREHKKTHELKMQEIDLHLGQMELEESELDGSIARLEYQLEHQELSAKDVERMQTELRQANSSLDQVERENQALDQEIWAEERSIAKKQEELERKVNAYNSLARKLKLIPADAENAHGIDYELRLNFHSIYTQHSPMLDFVSTIKPALIQLKKNINGEVHKLHSQRLNEEEALDQVKEMTEGKREEIRKLESQVQRLEKDVNAFKEKTRDETQAMTDRLADIEKEKEMARASGSTDVAQTQEQVRQMQSRYEEGCQTMQMERENYDKFLTQVCTMILEHKAKIQNHVRHLQEEAHNHLEVIRSMEIPQHPNPST
ncbi:kinetochore protein NDC80 homolog [Lytechinus pictus]|uniref:kinetochore protein NDC80 homolog n=1 Tax=Lytechinus pictus TaxID=7653 RepID=UPI0030BA00E7